jgi:hypothetical protein
MWYLAAILIYSATPPMGLFTSYETRFFPSPYSIQANCEASATSLNASPASSATPPYVKTVYFCIKL